MDAVTKALGATLLFIGGGMLLVILGTLVGAVCGWIVGLFFGNEVLRVASKLGLNGITMWEFGAFLGFVGGFLKTKVSS